MWKRNSLVDKNIKKFKIYEMLMDGFCRVSNVKRDGKKKKGKKEENVEKKLILENFDENQNIVIAAYQS